MLYIVATPIGNLGEITYRAVETLKSVDAVLCEDTRRTAILLNRYEIKKPLVSYQKFNEREKADYIIERLKNGENLALVSDAGMPVISDPGKVLIDELIKNELEYTVVSGPCALINAVVLSGLDASAFCMVGFLPEKKSERKKQLERFSSLDCTLIFYVAPHDAKETLEFLYSELGKRKVAIVREISKLHEEVVRGELGSTIEFTEKGEFVLKQGDICFHKPRALHGLRGTGENAANVFIISFVCHSAEMSLFCDKLGPLPPDLSKSASAPAT